MKILSSILAFYISFLVFAPGLSAVMINEIKSECCGGSCKPISEERSQPEKLPVKKDAGNQTDCNPFATCNVCSGYTVVLTFVSSTPEIFEIKQHTPFSENFPSEITLDFWHPPKIG